MIQGQAIVKGEAQGKALVTNEPLSFWGGYDYHTGEIIDRRHPLAGKIAAGRVLVVPFSRGSSTTTAVLLEAIKAGTAPAAILTEACPEEGRVDYFFALASIVADEMYKTPIPVVALTADDFASLQTGQWLHVHNDGRIEVSEGGSRE